MSYTLPAGTYVVGDLCYNLSDTQYEQFLDSSASLKKEGEVSLADGTMVKACAFYTASGDGRYKGLDRFEYAVDSGSIGIVPLAALEGRDMDESTKVVKFKHAFEVYDSAGTLVFGNIEINTNEDVEADEDDGGMYGEFDDF
jgi:hypothetical protein